MKKLLFLALSPLLFGCEKTPQSEPESKISFGVSEAYMITNESRAFVVVFDNSITDQTVTWSVDPANGGTISEDPTYNNVGIYKASTTPGTYKVLATLVSDPHSKGYCRNNGIRYCN
ncbi:MAG: Ig-like domain-containing protein [Marinilabiliales bacterium]|nr:Ig-like domain-containing protein [Marinilabiliales bacterium]